MRRLDTQKLGDALYRKRTGRSNSERVDLRSVGEITGVSASTLSRIENGVGEPTFNNVLALVDYLGTDVNDYITEGQK